MPNNEAKIRIFINEIKEFDQKARQRLILEAEYLREEIRNQAPLGITGALRDSFKTKVHTLTVGISAKILSYIEYAKFQEKERLRHVPKGMLGKKSFKHFGREKWTSTKSPKRLLERKKEKRKNAKSSFDQINYSRGYRLALEGKAPSEIYQADYVQNAVTARGGVVGIKQRIFGG